MNATCPTNASDRLISEAEETSAVEYLVSSREDLLQAVANLSDEQMKWKPSDAQWSITEIVEHVAIIEARVHGLIARISEAAAAEPDRNNAQIEEMIRREVPSRSTKIEAPPIVLPTGRLSCAETLEKFCSGRAETLQLLATAPFLRGHVVRHPFLGFWDGYQWLLATAAHTDRHNRQILEMRNHLGFAAAT